jgi:hypothetical protein
MEIGITDRQEYNDDKRNSKEATGLSLVVVHVLKDLPKFDVFF